MKNNELKNIKRRQAVMLTLQLIVGNVLLIFIWMLFIEGLLENRIANMVYQINLNLYYYLIDYKQIIFMISILFNSFLILYRYISKETEKKEEIYNAIDKIISEENQKISLPESESRFSQKINDVKYQYLLNKRKAFEEKQKKDDLIVYMAHDLKTPLTSVIGYLNLLNDEKDHLSKETQYKYINIALDKAKRVEELTNEFFEITKYDLHDIEIVQSEINIELLFQQLIDECYPMLKTKSLQCILHCSTAVMITADGSLLARAFENLLKNAISYSYEHTTIDIYLHIIDDQIEIVFQNKSDPIPAYKLEKLFEKFYRLDSSRNSTTGGSGLGLAISKEIIERHHGQIQVTNEDEYIRFIIHLPYKKEQ